MTLRDFLTKEGLDVDAMLGSEDFELAATVPDFQAVVRLEVGDVKIKMEVETPRPSPEP